MTVRHILIGIGGTGARVIEAALMLSAAGIGPAKVSVLLIDTDSTHGNGQRTHDALLRYHRLRQLWTGNTAHHIDHDAADAPDFARVSVEPLLPSGQWAWTPPPEIVSLGSLAQNAAMPVAHGIMDALFHHSNLEAQRPIQSGLNGQAHVGAALFGALFNDANNPVMRSLREARESRARIMLIGSGFGGTGAGAGMALARTLLPAVGGRAKHMAVGAMLLPPYFDYGVAADGLRERTDIAMSTLATLPVDQINIHAQHFAPVSHHARNGRAQCNPSMPLELIAAARALAYLDGAGDAGMYGEGHPASSHFASDDEARLQNMLRFAHFNYFETQARLRAPGGLFKGNWALTLAGKFDAVAAGEPINLMADICRRILEWAGSLQRQAEAAGMVPTWSERMWSIAPMTPNPSPGSGAPQQGAQLASPSTISAAVRASAFDSMLSGSTRQWPTHSAVIAALRRRPNVSPSHRGMGRTLTAAYQAVAGSGR